MARKTPQQTNILVHLAVWGLGTPILFAAMGAGFFLVLGAPNHEALTIAVVTAIVGLVFGFPLGIISFFVTRGARGWGEYFSARRAEKVASEEEALINEVTNDIAAHLEGSDALPATDDPWGGTNPYGCCQNNYDANGNLAHGSADCIHPLILDQRQAS